MRDPLTWSLPVGRVFGISVRLHLLFLLLAVSLVARGATASPGYGMVSLLMVFLLFGSVLLHEFGHCFGARYVNGDATEVLLWPLGGLAYVDVPNTPRAHFITTICGPAVNALLCAIAGAVLAVNGLLFPWHPYWNAIGPEGLYSFSLGETTQLGQLDTLMARLFHVNWLLFWFNMLLVGFPMDAGRLLQCALWPRLGFRQATYVAIYCGWIVAILLGLYVVIRFDKSAGAEPLLLLGLAVMIYITCKQHFFLLESGGLTEDSLFGYDFSQGYTSLERDQSPARRRPRQSFWQRWLERRAARKRQREEETRVADERRMDELLDKIQRQGKDALTDEERRFMTRVSARYRNRHQS